MFERKTIPHNLRNPQEFVTQRNRLANYHLECLSNQLPQLLALSSSKRI